MTKPATNRIAAAPTNPTYGSTPNRVAPSQARYIAHTMRSPWAKFTTRITPKISVRPIAIRL